ncbi:MAG: hypothetical protein EOO55_04105 [Hymenobacter sp.]|nr:MAG: hypothetical protein EOO55_04105 [Hymenobacter sp.]
MNEQLIVKNFGPIKDATVDFKRVTVFIGPTGGGKSTLAKLAAVFRDSSIYTTGKKGVNSSLANYGIDDFRREESNIAWVSSLMHIQLLRNIWQLGFHEEDIFNQAKEVAQRLQAANNEMKHLLELARTTPNDNLIRQKLSNARQTGKEADTFFEQMIAPNKPYYFPAERILLAIIGNAWASLIGNDIYFPNTLLTFAKHYLQARNIIDILAVKFLDVSYEHVDSKDIISLPNGTAIQLSETASGIQSVTPLLVLLEHLSRNTEQAQSFIIEEPELNLFPLAQFELVKILVDKCARTDGKNDLVLTTHSPYVLTALNLLCYAYRIAQQDEATAKKVAKLIPRHCWIDPNQFAAYYVDRPDTKRKQQVRSIINKKTGLIEENELDTASDELGAIFDKLVRLRKPISTSARSN